MQDLSTKLIKFYVSSFALIILLVLPTQAQVYNNNDNSAGAWGMKIFNVDSTVYPFVRVYARTFDGNQNPLRNVNSQNVGILVKGKTYSPFKNQYKVKTIKQAQVPVRTVLLIDASITMAGAPFEETLRAAVNYIGEKEEKDQIAVIEMNDSKIGYSVVSEFTDDSRLLGSRLGGMQPTATQTKIYDSVGAALQMCRAASGEGNSSSDASSFASCSLIIFSDGNDTGSALTRADLANAISNQSIPIPIHSLGYTKDFPIHLKNLQALSELSYGRYYDASESLGSMNSVVRNLQAIGKNDLLITFRSYIPVDGEDHAFKVGVEYPAGSGSINYGSGRFEAMESIPIPKVDIVKARLEKEIPMAEDNNPFYERNTASQQSNAEQVKLAADKEDSKPWWEFW
ncbi:MAG: vWA domain-containing protein [Arenicella sp.]